MSLCIFLIKFKCLLYILFYSNTDIPLTVKIYYESTEKSLKSNLNISFTWIVNSYLSSKTLPRIAWIIIIIATNFSSVSCVSWMIIFSSFLSKKKMSVHHFGSSHLHHLENIQFTSFKMNQCINNNSPPSWFCYFEFSYFFQFGVRNLKNSRISSELDLKKEYSTALFWTQFLKNISRSGISIIPNTRVWKQSHHK